MQMNRRSLGRPETTPGGIFALVRSGRATSRSEIAKLTGLAPSTITNRVDQLITAGYLLETGHGESKGGRRPRMLEVVRGDEIIAGVDLGRSHAVIGLFDRAGRMVVSDEIELDIAEVPDLVLRAIHAQILTMLSEAASPGAALAGVGLSMPGPVDSRTGAMVSPSRMPGWNGVNPASIMSGLAGVPAVVDNDANMLALGEFAALERSVDHMVVVKTGSSIGCGVIADGQLYHGFRGMAGDISHVSVHGAPPVVCTCGRLGCLDTVAGGRALIRDLREAGVEVNTSAELIALAQDAHPLATRLVREAGARTGEVLATIVNFFNPQRLVIAGSLAQAETFIVGVRSTIYEQCPSLATDGLQIAVAEAGSTGGASGAAWLMIEHLFSAAVIDERIESIATESAAPSSM